MTWQMLTLIGLLLWCAVLCVLYLRESVRRDRMQHRLLEILRDMAADMRQPELYPKAYRQAVQHYLLELEGVVNESD